MRTFTRQDGETTTFEVRVAESSPYLVYVTSPDSAIGELLVHKAEIPALVRLLQKVAA